MAVPWHDWLIARLLFQEAGKQFAIPAPAGQQRRAWIYIAPNSGKSFDSGMNEVTRLLTGIQDGQSSAAAELLPLVYTELRRLAAAKMAREQPGHTLQPTALVHEAWMRLVDADGQARFENRAH